MQKISNLNSQSSSRLLNPYRVSHPFITHYGSCCSVIDLLLSLPDDAQNNLLTRDMT